MDKIIEAANETETTWKGRAERGNTRGECGWCAWAGRCVDCPVRMVFSLSLPSEFGKTSCSGAELFLDWRETYAVYTDGKAAAADKIHALLVENRPALIAEARKIEEKRCETS